MATKKPAIHNAHVTRRNRVEGARKGAATKAANVAKAKAPTKSVKADAHVTKRNRVVGAQKAAQTRRSNAAKSNPVTDPKARSAAKTTGTAVKPRTISGEVIPKKRLPAKTTPRKGTVIDGKVVRKSLSSKGGSSVVRRAAGAVSKVARGAARAHPLTALGVAAGEVAKEAYSHYKKTTPSGKKRNPTNKNSRQSKQMDAVDRLNKDPHSKAQLPTKTKVNYSDGKVPAKKPNAASLGNQKSATRKAFEKDFRAARNAGKGTFSFRGKKYNTKLK